MTLEAGGVLGLLFAIGDPVEAIGDLTAEAIIVGVDAAVELGKVPYKEAKRIKANKENAAKGRLDLRRPSPYIPGKLANMFRKK
jgi:hypothetical protein